MLASLLMVLCLQMAAQTWEDVKVGTSTRKTLTYVPKNKECREITSFGDFSSWYESGPWVSAESDAMECAG